MSKYFLTNIIQKLSSEEQKKIGSFLRNHKSYGEKYEILFLNIGSNKIDEYDVDKIPANFNVKTKKEYYKLKHRFTKSIEKAIVKEVCEIQTKNVYKINLTLAEFYSKKNHWQLALTFWTNAEKAAIQNNKLDQQIEIVNQQIKLLQRISFGKVEDFIGKRKVLRRQKELIENANDALALYAKNARDTQNNLLELTSVQTNLNSTIKDITLFIEEMPNCDLDFLRSKLKWNLLFSQKKYVAIRDFMTAELDRFENGGFFTTENKNKKIALLISINQIATILKDLQTTIKYSKKLNEELLSSSSETQQEYSWAVAQSNLYIYMQSNDLEEGIKYAKNLKTRQSNSGYFFYNFSMNIFLFGFYYFKKDYSESHNYLTKIIQSEIYPQLPPIWQLHIEITLIIMALDERNNVYAMNKINSTRRKFASLLKKALFEVELLKLLRVISITLNKKEQHQKIKNWLSKFEHLLNYQDTLFYFECWLKSQYENRTYYELVLELINNQETMERRSNNYIVF